MRIAIFVKRVQKIPDNGFSRLWKWGTLRHLFSATFKKEASTKSALRSLTSENEPQLEDDPDPSASFV